MDKLEIIEAILIGKEQMPLIWRYLVRSYLSVFSLSVSAFVGVLFVLRFKDIARFAALSADGAKTALFVLYQFPHILPMAIPISTLIASFLLFQKLSQNHELTAMRASTLSLYKLTCPLLCVSLLFSFINFAIAAELAPYCRREARDILYRQTAMNPLLLLQRQQLIKLKNVYLELKIFGEGQTAKDFLCIAYNDSNQRLQLLYAKKLEIKRDALLGKSGTILSHFPGEKEEEFDLAILENEKTFSMKASLLSDTLKRKRPIVEPNALSLKQLLLEQNLQEGKKKGQLAWIEMLRRYSLSLAVFSFTLLGCAFGVQTGRETKKRPLAWLCGWAILVFTSYLLGKSLKSMPMWAMAALLLPHPILWLASFWRLHAVDRGRA